MSICSTAARASVVIFMTTLSIGATNLSFASASKIFDIQYEYDGYSFDTPSVPPSERQSLSGENSNEDILSADENFDTYSNELFLIDYPVNWIVIDNQEAFAQQEQQLLPTVIFSRSSVDPPFLTIAVLPAYNMDLDSYTQSVIDNAALLTSGFKTNGVYPSDVSSLSHPGYLLTYRYYVPDVNGDGYDELIRGIGLITIKDNLAYHLTYEMNAADYIGNLLLAQKMMDSFVFAEEDVGDAGTSESVLLIGGISLNQVQLMVSAIQEMPPEEIAGYGVAEISGESLVELFEVLDIQSLEKVLLNVSDEELADIEWKLNQNSPQLLQEKLGMLPQQTRLDLENRLSSVSAPLPVQ